MMTRQCAACLKDLPRDVFRRQSLRCRPCEYQAHREKSLVRNRAFRAKHRKPVDERKAPSPRRQGPFDVTLAALEPLWGPPQTWTRAQHAKHSAWLRQLAQIKDEPLTRSLYAA